MAGRKIFVGSLPNGITDASLRQEFGKYGQVEEVFVKPGCEPGRQWAFVTYASTEQAQLAKESCDRILQFPGSERPCDVMLAKNQGMFGQQDAGMGMHMGAMPSAAATMPRKIFVGSLPDGMTEGPLRAEFGKYGTVEDVFMKPNCESGRQWAFVTFQTPDQASTAVECTNGVLTFPGSFRACEVTFARNQGLFGQDSINSGGGALALGGYAPPAMAGPRKIFVGSLPDGITDAQLRSEFSKYGQIADVFMKQGCEPGRQWAFITFMSSEQAQFAKESCDRVLVFPGSERPCEVTMARHQGMFGQEPLTQGGPVAYMAGGAQYAAPAAIEGPKKIFVGSLPDGIQDGMLRAEYSKYGQIIDVYLKPGCEPGRQWGFVTFATPEQAQYAKDSTDRVLIFPGADRPCEVMLAKNQGKFGQAPLTSYQGGPTATVIDRSQPPPPATPPPAHLTPWRQYKTASGLPYYHNPVTGVTQWECPPELQAQRQVPGQPNAYGGARAPFNGGQRFSPY